MSAILFERVDDAGKKLSTIYVPDQSRILAVEDNGPNGQTCIIFDADQFFFVNASALDVVSALGIERFESPSGFIPEGLEEEPRKGEGK